MTTKLKLAAYVILIALAIWFAHGFHSNFSKVNSSASDDQAASPASQTVPPATTANAADPSTNNLAATNDAASSNVVKQSAAPTNAAVVASPSAPTPPPAQPAKPLGYLIALVGTLVGIGLLAAYDITQFLGSRTVDLLFNDQGAGVRDPEYEKAEAAWTAGRHLEAIEMMREYLKLHPRELYVVLRIAEIYEKDLRNYVAASLEYEEVLKKKLPAERWGWAAIHLCNIYSKLNQPEKTKKLLERIANDYPKTAAAKKARRNLGLPEPAEAEAPAEETQEAPVVLDANAIPVFDLDEAIASSEEEAAEPPPEAPSKKPPAAEPPKPNLPPGFRPR